MSSLKTILIDDEILAIKNLSAILQDYPEIEIIGRFTQPQEGLNAIFQLAPQLIFLDIQMPDLSGVQLAQKLLSHHPFPMIVFVTAYDDYALEAFRVQAMNYVLKPVDPVQINRVIRQIQQKQEAHNDLFQAKVAQLLNQWQPRDRFETRFLIKEGEKSLIVHSEEIFWVSGARNYVELHTAQKTYLMRKTMDVLASELNPSKFVRIHRSVIINIDELDHLGTTFSGQMLAVLKDKSEHKVSLSYQKELVDRFSK